MTNEEEEEETLYISHEELVDLLRDGKTELWNNHHYKRVEVRRC
mgnify:CR=1 FL=1